MQWERHSAGIRLFPSCLGSPHGMLCRRLAFGGGNISNWQVRA